MAQLRILVGYRTAHRHSVGTVLAASDNPAELQAAADAAPVEFERLELGTFFYQRKARRNAGSTPAVSPVAASAPGISTSPVEPATPVPPVKDAPPVLPVEDAPPVLPVEDAPPVLPVEDAPPVLLVEEEPTPSRRRR